MIFWRLEYPRHSDDALSGEGARRYGGRWNVKGTAAVYLSSCLSLAALEKFVHAQPMARGLALRAIAVNVPDDCIRHALRPDPLPAGWQQPEPRVDSMHWGSEWATSRKSLAAAVPSVLLPLHFFEKELEFNLMLNPDHPDMKREQVTARMEYAFDSRLWKG